MGYRSTCYASLEAGARAMPGIYGRHVTVDRCWTAVFEPNGQVSLNASAERGSTVVIHGFTTVRSTCPPYELNETRIDYRIGNVERFCGGAQRQVPEAGVCVDVVTRFSQIRSDSCPAVGNPLHPLTGTKSQRLTLGTQFGPGLDFELQYETASTLPTNGPWSQFGSGPQPSFGPLWSTRFHRSLERKSASAVTAFRGAGQAITFIADQTGQLVPQPNISDRLRFVSSGSWRYSEASSGALELYGWAGLAAIDLPNGDGVTLRYSDYGTPASIAPKPGLLIEIRDRVGRSYHLAYEAPSDPRLAPRVVRLADAAGNTTTFAYSAAGYLARVNRPDGSSLEMLYENQSFPWALTGMKDETGTRIGTYGYDTSGRAVSTEGPSGSNRFTVSWASPPAVQVSDTYDPVARVIWRDVSVVPPEGTVVTQPNGQAVSTAASNTFGTPVLTSQTQPAGSGCAAAVQRQTLDAVGMVASLDDFNGARTCYVNDPARRLEVSRIEGLAGGTNGPECAAATAPSAALPAGARKVSTTWHPQASLQVQVAEPGRITVSVYNGQSDPFSGNVVAACAPASARLPDGSPLRLLCRRVERATHDTTGAQGFAAELQASVAPREERWTYNGRGQVLTHDGPRSDVNDITQYVYHETTSFIGEGLNAVGHTVGDLALTVNPAGHITRFTKYDRLGQLRETVDPNGVVTTYTYNNRQQLTSTTMAGQSTLYEYWPTGKLMRVTQADGSWLLNEYDAAQRLVRVSDHLGNSVSYVLDAAGHRVEEQTRDPGGVLRRLLLRSMDALGRVQQIQGRE
jgi:YD repeat-containing protein